METIGYGTFSQDLHREVLAARVPINGTIEVSRRCPLRCVHCYNNLPINDSRARKSELTYDEHCRILDEIAEAGCLWLLFTGGEILARADFLDIYTYAKKKGFLISLFTNGTLITPRIADYLAEWRPFSIEITLYARTKETYERLTGIPGSYDQCLRGIRLLQERKLPVELKAFAVTINQHEIRELQRFVEDELGLRFKFDAMMNPRIDCSQSSLAVRLQPAEIVQLDLLDPARVAAWQKFIDRHSGPVHSPDDADELYHCGGGINSFVIDPEGKLSLCVLSHFESYDLRQSGFRQGWEDFIRKVRHKKATRITKCVACEIKAMCGMCPANGELEMGDPESPVDFLCHVAHLRAHSLGLSVSLHGDCEYCAGGSRYQNLMESLAHFRVLGLPGLKDSVIRLAPESPPGEEQTATAGCAMEGYSYCTAEAPDRKRVDPMEAAFTILS